MPTEVKTGIIQLTLLPYITKKIVLIIRNNIYLYMFMRYYVFISHSNCLEDCVRFCFFSARYDLFISFNVKIILIKWKILMKNVINPFFESACVVGFLNRSTCRPCLLNMQVCTRYSCWIMRLC